jgi:hypothetical protein
MWDYLVTFSTWAEGNSGQIQIVLGVTAFLLAVKAYSKALVQLDHSLVQSDLAMQNRFFDNKKEILTILVDLVNYASEVIIEIDRFETEKLVDKINDYKNSVSKSTEPSYSLTKSENSLSELKTFLITLRTDFRTDIHELKNISYENASTLENKLVRVMMQKELLIDTVYSARHERNSILLYLNPL